jgi:dipeptidyl aminopeptidase/acylaminoacyl peptidase
MHGVHDWNTELPTFSPNYDPRERVDVARLAFESSPMASVATWRSPVLLIHGDDDRNVPFAQTEETRGGLAQTEGRLRGTDLPGRDSRLPLRRDWVRAYSASAEFLGRKLGAAANPQR